MTSAIREKALVVIQLSGGNDCLDTVVPYTDGLYYDFRPTVHPAKGFQGHLAGALLLQVREQAIGLEIAH